MPEPASLNAAPRVDAPPRIDAANDIFPYCLVWTPIPVLTWVFPFVGHLGMGNSQGVLFDFAGPFYINQHQLAFGKPTRFIQLEPRRGWDAAVEQANAKYAKLNHNLCFQNCHSHVSAARACSAHSHAPTRWRPRWTYRR
jgi:hypothetical protein